EIQEFLGGHVESLRGTVEFGGEFERALCDRRVVEGALARRGWILRGRILRFGAWGLLLLRHRDSIAAGFQIRKSARHRGRGIPQRVGDLRLSTDTAGATRGGCRRAGVILAELAHG